MSQEVGIKEMGIKEVLGQFRLEMEAAGYGNGHINDTYLAAMPRYILQRINTSIFSDPDWLMENIENVTGFLREKIAADGGDPDRGTLTIVPTKDGGRYYHLDEENVFRVYRFVEGTKTIEDSKTPADLYEAGAGFGHFQKLLADFPADRLYESIPNFHNTKSRYLDFEAAVAKDVCGRAASVAEEIAFVREHREFAATLVDMQERGELPLRVTHNDTKLNNVLFDAKTGKPLAVVDLDTVMPGLSVNDFGDSIRFGATYAAEDEPDLSKVNFELELFECYTKGFLGECGTLMTPTEKKMLPVGAMMMTFECGMRFLADYLSGDTYFKIHREGHNLDRCRTQFKLVRDMEQSREQMEKIVEKYS